MKIFKLVTISILTILLGIKFVNAASFNISSSTNEITPNGTFTINVGGDCIGRVDLSVSNGSLSTSSVWVEQGYVNVKVTAGGSGQVKVTATPTKGFSDSDANEYSPGSRSISVNITSITPSTTDPAKPNDNPSISKPNKSTTPTTKKSSNNNLATLTINKGELSPKFDKNETDYTLNLPADTDKINIKATPEDSKAKISGIGDISLSVGNNNIKITVTAENGSNKTYNIKAYVDETPQVYLDYKNEKIGLIRNNEGITLPEGFTLAEYSIENKPIFIFSNNNIHFVYGLNENNEKNFYLFNKEKNEILSKFIPLNVANRSLFVVDTEIKKENLLKNNIIINDTEVICYKFIDGPDNYCLLNVLKEEGKYLQYLYESTENTIQLYYDFTKCPVLKEKKSTIIYILGTLLLLAVGIIGYLVIKTKKGKLYEKNI